MSWNAFRTFFPKKYVCGTVLDSQLISQVLVWWLRPMLLAVQDPPGKHIQSLKPTQSSYELRVNYFFCWNCSRITGESVNHICEFMVSYCMTGEFVVGQCRCIDIGCCRILRMSASLWTTCSLCHLVSVRMCKHLPCTDALTLWTRPCPSG